MDRAVLAAYGWSDLAPDDKDPILTRLRKLNAQRAAEEAAQDAEAGPSRDAEGRGHEQNRRAGASPARRALRSVCAAERSISARRRVDLHAAGLFELGEDAAPDLGGWVEDR